MIRARISASTGLIVAALIACATSVSAEEANDYGLIDHVIANFQEIDDGKKK